MKTIENPDFKKLVKLRRLTGWGAATFLTLIFAGTTAINAVAPSLLMTVIYPGSSITVGFVVMNLVSFVSLGLTFSYTKFANNQLTTLEESLRKEYMR